ncbi:MAG: hypothetical protein IKB64_05615, partial [Paludibacteraceae bacterium]|nr:hypothetical protein [Paludibacteraceae bacterium]
GYKTMELKFNKIPKDTLDITMVEQPILLTETLIPSKEKKLSKRKQMKQILADVRNQMLKDFPTETRKYKVVSDYDIYENEKVIAMEEIVGQIAEIPNIGRKETDSIQLVIDVCKRYRNKSVQMRLDSLDGKLKKEKNVDLVHLTDSSKLIHRVLWGSDIKWLFLELDGKISKWSMEEQDSTFLLTYREKKNYFGVVKYELVLNYILDIYSYRVKKLSQSLVVNANIPFGYKLNEDQLSILNVLNFSGQEMTKYRAKYINADIKRNIIYREEYDQVIPSEKNVITKVEMSERKHKKPLYVHQTGSIKVVSAQTSEVKPFTEAEVNQSFPVIEKFLE